jgi:hypothetical protein
VMGSPREVEPLPPSPRAAEAAEEIAPAREATRAAEVPTRTVEAPTHAAETTGGEAVATLTAATTSAEPPRKRKRGFSTLR